MRKVKPKQQKSRGGQPANQNAAKHGFYATVLKKAEQLELQAASEIEGLDEEIAVMRLKLRQLIENQPDRIDLHMNAASVLARMIRVQHQLTPEQGNGLREANKTVIKDIAIPLGVAAIEKHL